MEYAEYILSKHSSLKGFRRTNNETKNKAIKDLVEGKTIERSYLQFNSNKNVYMNGFEMFVENVTKQFKMCYNKGIVNDTSITPLVL